MTPLVYGVAGKVMRDPWQILMLDRRTATERDVKAAYARLLKLHRPDQDPEGFQRVREAYDVALAELKRGSRASADEFPWGQPKTAQHPVEASLVWSVPGEARPSLEQLTHEAEAALKAGDAELAWNSIRAVFERRGSSEQDAEHARARLAEMAGKYSAVLHQAVTRERLIRSLESDDASIFLLMCDHWRSTGNAAAPPVVAKHVLSQSVLMLSTDGAFALAQLGELLGFRYPDIARKLADLTYQHLPAEMRDMTVNMVEREVVLGKIFFGFPADQQRFWLPRLREPDRAWDWHGSQAQAAFDYIIRTRSITWAGLPLLCSLLPPRVGEALHQAVLEVAQRAQTEMEYGGGIPAGVKKGLTNFWLLIYGGGFALSTMLLLLDKVFPGFKPWLTGLFR